MPTPSQTPRTSTSLLWHPTDYLRVLYKRRWIAIPGFLLVFLSGTVNSIRTVPIYEAQTQLLIEKDARRPTSINSVLQEQDSWYGDDFLPTQVRILRSRSLAEEAVKALDEQNKPERIPAGPGFTLSVGSLVSAAQHAISPLFASEREASAAPAAQVASDELERAGRVARFLGGQDVVPIRTSRLVDLRFRSPDANYAMRAANEWARQYVIQVTKFRTDASGEAGSFLQTQLDEQRKKLNLAQTALQEYRERFGVAAVNDSQNIVIQQLTALTTNVTEARVELVGKEANFRQLEGIRTAGGSLESLPQVVASAAVQAQRDRIAAFRQEEAQLVSQNFGPEWPALRSARESLVRAEEDLRIQVTQIAGAIEAEYQAAQARVRDLEQQLASQQGRAMAGGQKAIEYNALEREAQSAQQLYDMLLKTVQESAVAQDFQGTNIRVVDTAQYPTYPVLPQTRRDVTMAAAMGLLLALGLAFGFEYFDSRIKSPDEVKAFLQLPFLGMIPNLAAAKNGTGEAPMLDPNVAPSFAEAIRAVRTAVLFSSAEEGARSVIVTSTGPSEGKTLISSSLAISLAQAGQRTLVIDADMRRPRLHEALGRSQEPGLSNVLVAEASLADAARQTEEKNLWVLSAGHIPPNPAELLGSKKFIALLADLKRRFDWIVIDAPPVMPVTDASVLAHSAGAVVFVVGSEMTPRQSATAALDQLRQANAKFVGVVLNRVNVHRHAYYYAPYYRKEYGKYYQRSPKRA
jgi:capsular exopolysaccharide synthesis family protein